MKNNLMVNIVGDKSTNISTQSELSLMVYHLVHGVVCKVREKFYCMHLEITVAESIFLAIYDA